MIIGDISVFAIESHIAAAYRAPGQRALGSFMIHIDGNRFGVSEPDATLLACSYDAVLRRIERRGTHVAPFAEADAFAIAAAYRAAFYLPEEPNWMFSGTSRSSVATLFSENEIQWAPDGDAAFDDGSFVLQFDILDRVRLIAFRSDEEGKASASSLKQINIESDRYYRLLKVWSESFICEWKELQVKLPC